MRVLQRAEVTLMRYIHYYQPPVRLKSAEAFIKVVDAVLNMTCSSVRLDVVGLYS